jgi:uncharacterized protein
MNDKFFSELKEKIQPNFEQGGSHAFDHTQRVYDLSLKLAKGQAVDIDILKAVALLHDIARMKEDCKEVQCHAEHGSEMAEKILEETNFPKEKIERVCYAIKIHRHSKGIKAETKEAQILQDADRLDALGAITIARMFSTGGKINRPIYDSNKPLGKIHLGYEMESTIHGFYAKILKITPDTFYTEKAKKIAKKRYAFVEKFLKQFMLEWEGKA